MRSHASTIVLSAVSTPMHIEVQPRSLSIDAGTPADAQASPSSSWRAGERAVAADDDEAAQPLAIDRRPRPRPPLFGAKRRRARRAEHGAAAPRRLVERAQVERRQPPGDEPLVAVLDADDLEPERPADARRGADRRVHAGRVAAGGQDRDAIARPESLDHGPSGPRSNHISTEKESQRFGRLEKSDAVADQTFE